VFAPIFGRPSTKARRIRERLGVRRTHRDSGQIQEESQEDELQGPGDFKINCVGSAKHEPDMGKYAQILYAACCGAGGSRRVPRAALGWPSLASSFFFCFFYLFLTSFFFLFLFLFLLRVIFFLHCFLGSLFLF
jgi:hypothetical protein